MLMSGISKNTALMKRYLLGDLSSEDQNRLEEKYFTDDDFLHALLEVKDQLMCEYVRGVMPVSERTRFEERFLATAEGRKEYEMISMLHNREPIAPPVREKAAPAKPKVTSASPRSMRRPSWGYLGACAAVAVALLMGSWLALRSGSEGARLASTAAPSSDLSAVLSIDLGPGQRRGDESREAPVAELESRHRALVLNLKTGRTEASSYQAEVYPLDEGNAPVFTVDELKAQGTTSEGFIPLEIPAGKLPEGDYRIELKGKHPDGTLKPMRGYFFSVIKK